MPDPSQPEASIEAEMSDSGARATPPDLPETTQPHQVRLILVRHGSSTWNEERRIQGQLDPPLSAKGEDQAARLAERLKDEKPAGFYSSDLARATATAGAIASRIGRRPVLLPGLREIALGEWEGLDREQIKAGYPRQWEQWTANPSWDIVPGSEGTKAFESRVGAALDDLLARHRTGEVLIVTHGGVIQVALLRILGRGSNGIFPFVIENTSLTVLEGRPGRWAVARVNDICHLN